MHNGVYAHSYIYLVYSTVLSCFLLSSRHHSRDENVVLVVSRPGKVLANVPTAIASHRQENRPSSKVVDLSAKIRCV
jgi:hypothetical protein